ncbi:isopentenyl-diphosphate Delta-isomerase [Celerinatantimonas diazotrophica]|uniref:Isopentenyl-diphosphate Delta-isomerase n=1 Tax=Celerinatantimonas diazotrophica TaxID=412034 RepID=A0A4R1J834_9GAMM|nr:isopentenyl-diphosphate Delta-isomerase [Celerinatantimonas diazotrophica]TCK46723.1 isopentenyl-diphosphate delta-isomerase [Celerinatantimonas diazotrophica]CAG9295425.1 Isopentenyl-diphosphate Delta-isomerase [Celerinatantimonas diazotrophica]
MYSEQVVLLNEQHQPIGQMSKKDVHHQHTPLHLGFSCYILNRLGQLLITRRAFSKKTWAGVWTNSVCGHPAPGEPIPQAVMRRSRQELGLNITTPKLLVADYRYRAKDVSGVVEYEYCPIWVARAISPVVINRHEVMDYQWVNPDDLAKASELMPTVFSPWMVEQIALLQACELWIS